MIDGRPPLAGGVPDPTAARPRRPRGLVLTLALVLALGSAAIHMIVPSLPALARDLAVAPRVAQQAVSIYLFGLAAGQLLAGPLVDRIGRRPVLIAGVLLYGAGAALASAAHSILWLGCGRAVQAIGGGASIVGARVIVGDLFGPTEAGRGQAQLMAVVLLSPAVAPLVGGLVSDEFGWRAVLALQALFAIAALTVVWLRIPETLPFLDTRRRQLSGNYLRLLSNGFFLRTAVAIATCSSALYMFLTVAPFLLIDQWGGTPRQAGVYFLLTGLTAMLGAFSVGRIERRHDAFRVGLNVSLGGAALAMGLAINTSGVGPALIFPAMIVTFGVGVSGPAGIARVLHAEKGLAGTAASVSGALQMVTGGMTATALGLVVAPSFMALAAAMTLTLGVARVAAPRR